MSERIDQPRVGTYSTTLCNGGIKVGVLFWREADQWRVEIDGQTHRSDGEPIDPFEVWPYCRSITVAEFKFLERRREWARQHAWDHPAANPRRPIDLRKLKPGW